LHALFALRQNLRPIFSLARRLLGSIPKQSLCPSEEPPTKEEGFMSAFTYPGVYIEELSSGVHTITGVATSIAAFVGWAPMGPVDDATMVESWAQYQSLFGGLDSRSLLGYAVNQFFANGGQQAYIIRLVWQQGLPPAPSTFPLPAKTAVAAGMGSAITQITASLSGVTSPPLQLSVGSAVLQSITITPGTLPPLPLGSSLTFTATGNYSNGTHSSLVSAAWTSSDPAVVSITTAGAATAMAAGSAVLTASSGIVAQSLTVTVTPATLSSIAISPATVSFNEGQAQPAAGAPAGPTQQLSATANYSDGTTQNVTAIATWSSADTTEATFAGPGGAVLPGLVIAGTSGTSGSTTVTAAWLGVSGTATINYSSSSAVLSLAIEQAAPVLSLKPTAQTVTLSAVAMYSSSATPGAAPAGTWTSSNPAVATVNSSTGVVTAVAPGATTITFNSGSLSASTTLTVTNATLNSISLTPINPSVAVGLNLQLNALGIYSDGTTANLTTSVDWTSGTPADATVNANTGVVTGKAVAASVTMTASWQGLSPTINVAVTAAVLQSIAITPAGPLSILPAQTQQFAATGIYSGSTTPVPITPQWASSAPSVASINSTGLATAQAAGGSLTLWASNPGAWGNSLSVQITPSPTPGRFGLLVQQTTPSGTVQTLESYSGLSVTTTDSLYVVTVIDNDSNYITFIPPGSTVPVAPTATPSPMTAAVSLSGGADGSVLTPASDGNFEVAMLSNATAGVYLLDRVDIFNILCVPAETDGPTIQDLQEYCWKKRAFYIVDSWQLSTTSKLQQTGPVGSTSGSITGQYSINSAFYFPWIEAPDPLFGNRMTLFPPCGFVAGIYAATDAARGVWKAPAGIDASLTGVLGLQYNLTDQENGDLNIQAINCLREFKVYGDVVWGARTLQGNDQAGSEWKYVPIRRFALFLESSLYDGTQWVVFEPNDETLWGQIRLNINSFLQGLFLKGAFAGTTPQQAYFVKCDAENNPPPSVAQGIVNILVGFAPLYPAEFVVIQIQQMAGQTAS
jgi:phage tail sheath protein FI